MVNMTSKIVLAKDIRLDRGHQNVLDYTDLQMLAVMNSSAHFVADASDYSFIRSTGTIKADINYDQALRANYFAYQNPSYSNKWFFAFIDRIEYKGENCIEIFYTVDNWETWFKDLTLLPCFVEREHTLDDTRGNNLLPEPNGVQTYILNSSYTSPAIHKRFTEWKVCVVAVTDDGAGHSTGYMLNDKMPCACNMKVFKLADYDPLGVIPPVPNLSDILSYLDTLGGDYGTIVNIFCYPSNLISISGSDTDITRYASTIEQSGTDWNFSKPHTLNGYTPKNNKMFTYPYCWLEVSTGEKSMQYRYEFFDDSSVCPFALVGGATPIPEINVYPLKYQNYGNEKNPANKISLNNFPQIALPIDSYKAWLAQSSSAQLNSILRGGAASMITGITSGGGMAGALSGAASSMVGGISNYLNSEDYAKKASDSYSGTNTASIDQALGLMGFDFKHYAADYEEARNMDHFLSMFGYTTRRVKIPNITGRQYWNYIKINGVIGHGAVPAGALEDVNSIANSGVTIWHDHENIGNYTIGDANLANPII